MSIFLDTGLRSASRRLIEGDALGALNQPALRDDPPVLALRGMAFAQLGELSRARAREQQD